MFFIGILFLDVDDNEKIVFNILLIFLICDISNGKNFFYIIEIMVFVFYKVL